MHKCTATFDVSQWQNRSIIQYIGTLRINKQTLGQNVSPGGRHNCAWCEGGMDSGYGKFRTSSGGGENQFKGMMGTTGTVPLYK